MAIYTTFFLCKPKDLLPGFPGWRPPRARPVRREVRIPFTGETKVILSREPDWPEGADEVEAPAPRVVAITGSYEDYLQARLPPFVRGCPHWATKGLTEVELAPLLAAVGVDGTMEEAIYSPPSSTAIVDVMPATFARRLGALDPGRAAELWAAAMSTPEFTHSVSGTRVSDGWTAEEALGLLQPLMALAGRATAGQRMYLLVEA